MRVVPAGAVDSYNRFEIEVPAEARPLSIRRVAVHVSSGMFAARRPSGARALLACRLSSEPAARAALEQSSTAHRIVPSRRTHSPVR